MLIFVLFDGIKNSVFDGQVLRPMEKKLQKNKYKKALIISFEKEAISQEVICEKVKNKNIKLIILKRFPYLGKLSLIAPIYNLKKVLKDYKKYDLVARGPIASYICAKAVNFSKYNSFVMQARGLLGCEYKYASKNSRLIKKLISYIRYWQLQSLERNIYNKANKLQNTKIEAVSVALKEYLVTQFGVNTQKISIAQDDIPQKFEKNIITKWRKEVREKLNIPNNIKVYCYNGSVKPWQCPQETVQFFKKRLEKEKNIFLLLLTQNIKEFKTILKKANIADNSFFITQVAHNKIYNYLAACDYGIIFREPSIVNWVSRPTKILEYKSVGLTIIHNNTVGILRNKEV